VIAALTLAALVFWLLVAAAGRGDYGALP